MPSSPEFVSIVLVYKSCPEDAALHLAYQEPCRTLTPRERAERLYDLGEFAAAAQLLLPPQAD